MCVREFNFSLKYGKKITKRFVPIFARLTRTFLSKVEFSQEYILIFFRCNFYVFLCLYIILHKTSEIRSFIESINRNIIVIDQELKCCKDNLSLIFESLMNLFKQYNSCMCIIIVLKCNSYVYSSHD